MSAIARLHLRLGGWTIEGGPPADRQFVMACGPHTSLWDGLLLVLGLYALRVRARWLIKAELMVPPLGWFLGSIGAVAVHRAVSESRVAQLAREFERNEGFVLAVAPMASRKKRDGWRSGFHAIARTAGVPIVPTFLDYSTRTMGMGPPLQPTEDIEADLRVLGETFEGVTGLRPELQTPIQLLP